MNEYEINTETISAKNQSKYNAISGMALIHVQYVTDLPNITAGWQEFSFEKNININCCFNQNHTKLRNEFWEVEIS
jgi:hypothetical protein